MSRPAYRVDDPVEVSCTCGKPNCFSPASDPKRGTVYDVPFRGRMYVDFWDTHGPNPDNADDSRCYEFRTKDVRPLAASR